MYECVRTIASIYPNPQLMGGALESVAWFLGARENNLKYAGGRVGGVWGAGWGVGGGGCPSA